MSQSIVESDVWDRPVETAFGVKNREISERSHGLVQYVRDLYVSGAKLWTKDMFHDIEAELAKEPKPDSVMIRSMNGVLRRKQVPLEGLDPQLAEMGRLHIVLRFKKYQEIVYDAEEESTELDEDDKPFHMETDIDDDLALTTCTLTLVRTGDTPSSIEYGQLKVAWDEARRNWIQSPACTELTAILGGSACIPTATRRIVCFGLGSLEGPPDHSSLDILATCDGLPLRRALTQHAAALTIAVVLGKRLGTDPLPILAQDPAYSAAAKRLLTDEGIEVVGGCGSLAFTHVDESTIVFSCSPDIPVKQVVADISRPAAMVWNRVTPAAEEKSQWTTKLVQGEEVLCSPWTTDQDSNRTRKLVEDYNKYEFPTARERFGTLEIYVRRD